MADNEKLGSTSPQILLKNATNLDKLVNGRESESLPDRFAVLRRTWYGMEMIFNRFITYITGRGEQAVGAIGWQELGNWATGLTVDNRQQIVYYNGSWYKYLGELEHVITGDSPENDGGVWSAENPTGKWSNIGDAALRSNLGSGEGDPIVAPEKVRAALGGTVSEAIRYVSVDGFEPDLTGTTDSTLSVLKAAAVAKTLADSAYVTGDTKYYVVRYGFGAYMQGDVPLYTGITYDGQENGTFIIPKPGAKFCFTTKGTEPYATSSSKRLYNATIKNLRIGCAFRETVFPVPAGVGGINIEYASYIKIENVEMRMLNGPGLVLKEVWDSDIDKLRMMKVGNITDLANIAPALNMSMGDGTDGCNAIRFNKLHIEECPKPLQLEPGCRHIFFTTMKLEGGSTTSTIVGAAGMSF
ncbi:hypothetical protein QTL54_26910, partial [Klebsiella michiganensis]